MATLAEGYVHLKPYLASRGRLAEIGEISQSVALEAAQRIYRGDVILDVTVEEGSAKAWFTVFGTLAAAVAGYPNLKAGVIDLVKDGREFSEYVSQNFIEKSQANPEQIFRVERRTKTPGKIAKVIKKLEDLDATPASPERRRLELAMVRQDLEEIERDLKKTDANFLYQNLVFENLPPLQSIPAPIPIKSLRYKPAIGLPPRTNGAWVELPFPQVYFDANSAPAEPANGPVVYAKVAYVPRVTFRQKEEPPER